MTGLTNEIVVIESAFKFDPGYLLWIFDSKSNGCEDYPYGYGCIN